MWYNVEYKKLSILLLPTFLRQRKTVAYLCCLVQPIESLHQDWKISRLNDWYKLSNNGQVCRLEKVLNDAFDPTQRRIHITDGDSFAQEYIFTEAETDTVFLDDTLYIYSEDEYQNTGVDFVVNIPQDTVAADNAKLKYLIKYYKLAGKRHRIQVI